MNVPNRDDILRDETFKGDARELDKRIYLTLTMKPSEQLADSLKMHRIAKLLADLAASLHERGILDDDELDDMLFHVVR
jgi:hypothetical protein